MYSYLQTETTLSHHRICNRFAYSEEDIRFTMDFYEEPPKKLPTRTFDVVVAGGGTGGVVAALAAARQGANDGPDRGQGLPGRHRRRGRHRAAQLLQPVEGLPRRGEAPGRTRHPPGDRRPAGREGRHLRPRRDDERLRLRLGLHGHRHRDLQAGHLRDAGRGRRHRLRQHAADVGHRRRLAGQGRHRREPLRPRGHLRQLVRGLHRLRRPFGLRRGRLHRAQRLPGRQQHRRRRRQCGEVLRVPGSTRRR